MAQEQKDQVIAEEQVEATEAAVEEVVAEEHAEEVAAEEVEVVEEEIVAPSVASIFEGMDLSEEFKEKMTVVFDAAVNEEVTNRVATIESNLTTQLDEELNTAVEAKVEEIVENLDSYLDYVVNEWVSENEVAIEAGIKVEMAESLMNGLQDLFQEHNIEVDEETLDVVGSLEEDYADLQEKANSVMNENIELQKQISKIKADAAFEEIAEGLTVSQKERLKILSEKLNVEDAETYTADLTTLKESFFADNTQSVQSDANVDDEVDEIITEETEVKTPASEYTSVNALVEALNARKSK